MANPRRVRRRYPKMPDVTVDDVDQLPTIPRAGDDDRTGHEPTATSPGASLLGTSGYGGDEHAGEQRRFATHPGEVTAAIAIWQPSSDGTIAQHGAVTRHGAVTKHYDTRIRYVTDDGPQVLKIVVPAVDFLPLGTRVDVEEQSVTGRVRVHRRTPPPAKGMSWKRPDLRGALIALVAILAITAIIGVIGYLIGRSKQPNQQPPPPPGVTIQQDGKPVQQNENGLSVED